MDYIQFLRQKVGHEKVLMPSTSVCIYDETGALLLQKRSDNGKWGLPGGYMELGESISDTAVREVYEEMGYRLVKEQLELKGVFSKYDTYYPNGDAVQTVCILFQYAYDGSMLQYSDEVETLQFFQYNELPEIFNAENTAMVHAFFEKKGIVIE